MADSDYSIGSHISMNLPPDEARDAPVVFAMHEEKLQYTGAGLLALPRELRNQIYNYLLRIDRFDTSKYVKEDLSKLELSILRTNQILHKEASEILYEANPLKGEVEYKQGFPGDKPVSLASYRRATLTAVALISLQRLPHHGDRRDRICLLVSLFAMPRLCRILTDYEKITELEIDVRFHVQDPGRMKAAWRESLLDCFKEARGFGRAIIVDAQENTSHVELATLMTSPFKHFRDLVDRASTYHDRALQKQNLGRLSEARCDYQDGRDFISWFLISKCYPNSNLIHQDKKSEALSELYTAIGFSCAFLSIKLGDLDWALGLIEWTLGMQDEDEEGYSPAQTQGWFLYGMRDLAVGADNGAIYCFLQTLWKQPGHPGADEAVDEIESRLRSCPDLNERIILHNIEHVLQPFRHQTPGSTVMSKDGYELLQHQWYAGKKEIDSIGYLHCSDGSVSLDEASRDSYAV